jgi:pilus assembly protein CpaF
VSHLATRSPSHLDSEALRLARAIRDDVAEAVASERRASPQSNGRPGGAPSHEAHAVARDCASRALDEHVARLVAAGGDPPPPSDEHAAIELVVAMIFGLGVLQLFVEDPSVENIDVNGAERAFVTYCDGTKELVGPVAESDEELVAMVRSAAARFGLSERRFDQGQPELDLRLPDGSRLSAVMGVTEHPVIDIRRHRLADLDLGDLVDLGMLDAGLGSFLAAAVRAKRNILVSGSMNAGKTTLLRALAAEIPSSERIVTIEQALELGLERQVNRHPDCVAMEARLANTEGAGAIGLAQLVRRSLRMNASRVIVGEVLGDEVIPMLNAMSQGRSGSMGTIHADSSAGVFRRIAAYAVQAPERLPLEAANLLIAGAIHFVVHIDLREGPSAGGGGLSRRIASVREVVDAEGPLVVSNEVFRADRDGLALPSAPLRDRTAEVLADHGYDARCPGPSMSQWR